MSLKSANKPESPPSAWDAIAPAWYNFRHYTIFKAELEALAVRWQKGRLLNLGCGRPQAEAAVRKAKAAGGAPSGPAEFEPLFRRALELVR